MVPLQLPRDGAEDKAECGTAIRVHRLLPLLPSHVCFEPNSLLCLFHSVLCFQFALDLAPVLGGHRRFGVVRGAAEAPVQRRRHQGSLLVILAEGVGAELTEGHGRIATDVTLMPWTFPLS